MTSMPPTPPGYVIYEGPSQLDGAPITAIATLKNSNPKIGAMVQVWIIRADITPVQAMQTGEEASVCGRCLHRGHNGKNRSCYVEVGKAPLSIYGAYQRGRYVNVVNQPFGQLLSGRKVRLGAYGDPLALPFEICAEAVRCAVAHTGYTHQWFVKNADSRFKQLVMASVDNPTQYHKAKAAGWRTFRVTPVLNGSYATFAGEAICPASAEAGKKATCETGAACNGQTQNIVIGVHGSPARIKSFRGDAAKQPVLDLSLPSSGGFLTTPSA